MDFEPSPEQEELQRSVRRALAQECPRALVRDVVERGAAADAPWKCAGRLGWTGITVPERFGGLGLSFAELGLVVEEHGRVLAPGPFLATTTQFAPLVREAGSEAQQALWLSGVAEGRIGGALALDGLRGSAGLPDASLAARREAGGWRLSGARHFVPGGDAADEVALVARVEAGDGYGLFVLPRAALRVEAVAGLDASRPLARVFCDDVRVEPERVLGEPGAGAEALARALDEARVALALETVGVCQTLFDLTLAHARERVQFDRPIGSFQAVQHKFADMLVQLEKARSLAYFAMLTVAEDDPRRRLAASLAKVAAGDCQRLLCQEAIQIHGGVGFTWECDVQLFVKRAKASEALLGSSRAHRERIAELLAL
jgi:alkylation response protein AidB-like acyl-CoA dehydrogenase